MKAPKGRVIRFSILATAILGACSMNSDGRGDPARLYQNLLDALGTGNAAPLYAAAAVRTPQGLWNVYVVSSPPDDLVFRQSRQDAEIEFGMSRKILWRNDVLTQRASALTADWRYFVRSYELFRIGLQLRRWEIHEFQAECKKIDEQREPGPNICLVDEFGKLVSVQVDDESLPRRITRELPKQFGGGVSVILPTAWMTHNGEHLMTGFQQRTGTALFRWDFQTVIQIPNDEVSIDPPAILK